jgi:hypothetical protein
MTDQSDRKAPITARVIEIDAADELARPRPIGPQVIATERTEPVTPSERSVVVVAPPPARRRDGVITFGLAGVAVFFVGWLVVDAAAWISTAFERSAGLGILAAAAISAGVAGAGLVIARELASLFRLKNVETIHRSFADQHVPPADARRAIADVLAVVPRERETAAGIEAFQRQVQLHHSTAQQIEILSRTVMKPLDRRAEAHVRTAVLRAFGITAISPTALTDAVFFLACGVRMVRGIAASYGTVRPPPPRSTCCAGSCSKPGSSAPWISRVRRWCSISAAQSPSGSPPARPTRCTPPIAWPGSASSSWICAGRSRSRRTMFRAWVRWLATWCDGVPKPSLIEGPALRRASRN